MSAGPKERPWDDHAAGGRPIDLVRASFRRCHRQPRLLHRFYDLFMGSDPRIAAMFAATDMIRQREALRHGINLALMHAEGKPLGEIGMRRIRDLHRERGLALAPAFYALWIESLIRAVSETDPAFSAEVGRAWRAVLQAAVACLGDAHGDRPTAPEVP